MDFKLLEILVSIKNSYKLSNFYNLSFSIKNLLNKGHENSYKYTGPPRTFDISLKKVFSY